MNLTNTVFRVTNQTPAFILHNSIYIKFRNGPSNLCARNHIRGSLWQGGVVMVSEQMGGVTRELVWVQIMFCFSITCCMHGCAQSVKILWTRHLWIVSFSICVCYTSIKSLLSNIGAPPPIFFKSREINFLQLPNAIQKSAISFLAPWVPIHSSSFPPQIPCYTS